MTGKAGLVAAVLAASLALSACGGLDDSGNPGGPPSPTSGGIAHGSEPGDLLLRVEFTGGFVAADWYLRAVPAFSLFGDGTLVVPGPQVELYPGPALPNLQARVLTEEALQRILEAAREAGLSGPDRTFNDATQHIADATTTVFTIEAEEDRHQTSIYAFSEAPADGDFSSEEREARRQLSGLMEKLTSLDSWLPEGSVGEEHAYEPSSMRVLVTGGAPVTDEAVEQRPVDWPLEQPLEDFGRAVDGSPARCGVVSGADLAEVLETAGRATELTPWRSAGKPFTLRFRPLLPGEPGCPPRS